MNDTTDRREYYRLEETLLMAYHCVQDIVSDEKNTGNIALIDEFSSISQQMKLSIGRMHPRSPEIVSCFKLLDAKINALAQLVLYQDDSNNLSQMLVNISAGGMSFGVKQRLEKGTMIELELVLPPDLNSIKIMAKVVQCEIQTHDDYAYVLSAQFEELDEITQDAIVRHIMHVQANALRKKKIDKV